jgi:DNA repair protein RadC
MLNYENLSNEDLLKMLILEKKSETVVEDLLAQFSTLPDLLFDADENELTNVKGIGLKRVQQIKAAGES